MNNVPFKPDHFDLLEMRAHERTLDQAQLRGVAAISKSSTFIIDGRILCVAGILELWTGVAEVFIIPSIYVSQYSVPFLLRTKTVLNAWQKRYHRLQTASVDNEETNRFMTALGFKCEGVLVKYGANGLNYRQWARVK